MPEQANIATTRVSPASGLVGEHDTPTTALAPRPVAPPTPGARVKVDEAANPIRVVLVDDDPVMRTLIRYILERAGLDIVVVGEAEDGSQGLRCWRELRPDVLVLDEDMPGLTGLQLAIRILAEEPDQRMLLCTALPEGVEAAARALGVALVGKRESERLPQLVTELYEA